MKPMARKRLTVDVIERRQVCFRLEQKALDRDLRRVGTITALTDEGALLRRTFCSASERRQMIERWFCKYAALRPSQDGRRYFKEVKV